MCFRIVLPMELQAKTLYNMIVGLYKRLRIIGYFISLVR